VAEESGRPVAAPAHPEAPPAVEAAPPDEPGPDPTKVTAIEEVLEWPRCGFCGSLSLHESSRGGFRESWLRWGSAGIYRCDACSRRFAFAPLGRYHGRRGRRRDGMATPPVEDRMRGGDQRRRWLRGFWTVLAALLTFVLAAWMINRSEQRYLEGEVQVPQRR